NAQRNAREHRKIKSRRRRPTENRVDQPVRTSDPEKTDDDDQPSDNDDHDVHARAKIGLAPRFTSFFASFVVTTWLQHHHERPRKNHPHNCSSSAQKREFAPERATASSARRFL